MRRGLLALSAALFLGGCATETAAPPAPQLPPLADQLFRPSDEVIDAHAIFAVNDAMREYLNREVVPALRTRLRREELAQALYRKGELKLEFDAERTRTASEAFADKEGNCLSLVIMTGALAESLGLKVRYQRVLVDDVWSRSGDNYVSIGHVNIALAASTLGPSPTQLLYPKDADNDMVIDFLPPKDLSGLRVETISRDTVIAMFMNNRAVESLVHGKLDDAYWWARAAIKQDPTFINSYNTLGVIYQRHGDKALAAQVFGPLLKAHPDNTIVMSNQAVALASLGREAEANALNQRLHELEPYPPYYYFNLGRKAMAAHDYATARRMFAKEIDRDPYNDEFHFWLASADYELGDVSGARDELSAAMDSSTTHTEYNLYAAKLARLSAVSAH